MKIVTYSDLRKNLAKIMDQAADDREPVMVRRKNGKAPLMVSLEDMASWDATRYLNASPANAKALDEAIAQAERGEGMIAVEFDEKAGVFRPIRVASQAAE